MINKKSVVTFSYFGVVVGLLACSSPGQTVFNQAHLEQRKLRNKVDGFLLLGDYKSATLEIDRDELSKKSECSARFICYYEMGKFAEAKSSLTSSMNLATRELYEQLADGNLAKVHRPIQVIPCADGKRDASLLYRAIGLRTLSDFGFRIADDILSRMRALHMDALEIESLRQAIAHKRTEQKEAIRKFRAQNQP